MVGKFLRFIDNEKQVYFAILLLFVLLVIVSKLTIVGTTIVLYLFMGLFYLHIIRRSILKAKTIFLQIIWLLFMPLLIALLPLILLDLFFQGDILASSISTPLYILFFVLTWICAVFLFDYSKIRVAIQFINASVLSILGITFLVYFTPDFMKLLFGKQMLTEINAAGLGAESIFDIVVKLVTLPYFLSCLWANFAIELRGYQIEKKRIKGQRDRFHVPANK